MAGPRCIELADPSRVEALAVAPNVRIVRKRRTREVIEVHIQEVADESRLQSRSGSSIWLVHKHESQTNPPNCWTHKRVLPVERTVIRDALAGGRQNDSSPASSQAGAAGKTVPWLCPGKQGTKQHPICAD